MMSSAIKTQWSAIGCYNYYSGSQLETYETTEEEQKNILNQGKDYLCINDTLYIVVYMY